MKHNMSTKIPTEEFYNEFHGHKVSHLGKLVDHARNHSVPIIFLAGDSSLDNKYWLLDSYRKPAPFIYRSLLLDPFCVQDVAYHLTAAAQERYVAINCAVEESTLAGREKMLTHTDVLITENMRENDVLVVSVGGNDIALRPSLKTVMCLASLMLSPNFLIDTGYAPGLDHFTRMFSDDISRYISRLTFLNRPQKILVCMIYFPDENSRVASWANTVLSMLGYNSHPEKLQFLVKKIFTLSTERLQKRLHGLNVVPVPLFSVLDGKDTRDYVQRVEPSVRGSGKIASLLLGKIL
jgi:hypothetical protein